MSEPSKEHIEAVAGLIDEWLYRMHGIQSSCRHEVEAAEFLCSHDPAVLDAMQDALVRAGRLTEMDSWRAFSTAEARLMRRYVTEWQETTGGDDAA